MTIAIYIRLSLEDGDLSSSDKLESESITNQRSMLVDYIRTSPELCDAEIMCKITCEYIIDMICGYDDSPAYRKPPGSSVSEQK